MHTSNDIHHQFATYFNSDTLLPYAYLVSKKLSEGHICVQLDDLANEKELLPPYIKASFTAIDKLLEEQFVTTDPGVKQPFVFHNNRLYLQRYFHYETMILGRIEQFIGTEAALRRSRIETLQEQKSLIKELFKAGLNSDSGSNDTDWQLAAVITGVLNNFTIITGGPGTGKTTTVAKILAILFSIDQGLNVALAAPTGKAAARMAESLKSSKLNVGIEIAEKFQSLELSTIHRLLKYVPDSPYFRHNRSNPLYYDVVIVDESSMVDAALFAKLLDAVGPTTRLILLGDKDQLASVEAGSLFGDLCQAQEMLNLFSRERADIINSFIDEQSAQIGEDHLTEASAHPLFQHIIELQKSHRFHDHGGIGKFSKSIIRSDEDVIKGFLIPRADEQVVVDLEYSQSLFEQFVKGYEDYITEQDIQAALFKLNRLRILCAIREGDQGLYAMNRKVERYLEERKLVKLSGEFYEHRPIIVTSNNYALGLFNGDVGIIRKDEQGVLKAWFEDADGEIRSVLPALISNVETVYAMTIHKSQGSEFNEVLVILPDTENISILTRELLYTGVTRAKIRVYVMGSESVILATAKGQVKRASGIAQRFIQN